MTPTHPFWLNQAPYQDIHTPAVLPQESTVVVIGGGITGVSTAYWLRREGIDVTLLEARGISGGATGRNGGLISPGTTDRIDQTVKTHGVDTALAIWEYTIQTIEGIKAFVAKHKFDCELRFQGRATIALSPEELDALREWAAELNRCGLPGTYWDAATCAEQTRSRDFLGAVFHQTAGQLWAAKLTFEIVAQAIHMGAGVQTQTRVEGVDAHGDGLTVRTSRGDLTAQQVVYATNAWTRDLLPNFTAKITPVRGQVIMTEPVAPIWPFSFSCNYGYEYFMQRPDGRIVLGGMRWLTTTGEAGTDDDSVIDPVVSQGLHEFLPRHFPDLKDVQVEQEWTGIMGFSVDSLPCIGPIPDRPGEYIAAGFTGHGMPMAFYAGKAIAEMIAGRDPEVFVAAFLPQRLFTRAG